MAVAARLIRFTPVTLETNGMLLLARRLHSMTCTSSPLIRYWTLNGPRMARLRAILRVFSLIVSLTDSMMVRTGPLGEVLLDENLVYPAAGEGYRCEAAQLLHAVGDACALPAEGVRDPHHHGVSYLAGGGERLKLVAEAYPHHGHIRLQQPAHRRDRVDAHLRLPRTVRDEYPRGVEA
jgi:hypothetical protein